MKGDGFSLNSRFAIFEQLESRSDKFSAREIMTARIGVHPERRRGILKRDADAPVQAPANSVVFARRLYACVTARISRASTHARATARCVARFDSVS